LDHASICVTHALTLSMPSMQQKPSNTMKFEEGRSVDRARPCRRRAKVASVQVAEVVEEKPSQVPRICLIDLLAAVGSLYHDKLRPYGRLVRKRLRELASARGAVLIESDLGRLRRACEECSFLSVEAGAGSEWSVLLVDREAAFVDTYSNEEVYPTALWTGITDYLRQLDETGDSLPGGRYSCARVLLESGLPCLQGRSLGEVCHIVQLAMSEKKLLGYLDGTIAPYGRSNSMVKDTAAKRCMGSSPSQQLPLASRAEARSCMVDVLRSAVRKGRKQVPISTLKRLFRSRFHIELSETALGCTKLSDLLQNDVFSDICCVKLLERGYVLLPSEELSLQPLDELKELRCAPFKPGQSSLPTLASAVCSSTCSDIVRHTFIHINAMPSGALRRSRSVPKDVGSQVVESEEGLTFFEDMSTDVGSGSLTPAFTASPQWTPREQVDHDVSCSGFWQADDLYADPFATPCCTLDLTMGLDKSVCLPGPWTFDSGMCHFSFPTEDWTSTNEACAPTWLAAVEAADCPRAEPEYISKKACDGSVVRNTFIELATPCCSSEASRHRSQSVPRNLGSDKAPSNDGNDNDMFITKPLDSNLDIAGGKRQANLMSPKCPAPNYWAPSHVDNGMSLHLNEPARCVLHIAEFL